MKKLEIRKFTSEGSEIFANLIQNKPINIIEEVNKFDLFAIVYKSSPNLCDQHARQSQTCSAKLSLRPWEKIGTFLISIEPFSIQNGQLTQTLKVKNKFKIIVSTVLPPCLSSS